MTTGSPYRLDLLVHPDANPPAKYAGSVDRVTEYNFDVAAGTCRRCQQPRNTHLWTLWDGDHLIDCGAETVVAR